MQLARCGRPLRAVRLTIDHQAAGTADAFPAIVVERDRFFILGDELFVYDVQHFEERRVVGDPSRVLLEVSSVIRASLSPNLQGEVENFRHVTSSLVVALCRVNGFPDQRFFVQHGIVLDVRSTVFPCGHVRERIVVTLGLAAFGLRFLTEVTAA